MLTKRPRGIEITSDDLGKWKLLPAINWAARFSEYWTPGEEGAQKNWMSLLFITLADIKGIAIFQQKMRPLDCHLICTLGKSVLG